MSTPFRRVAAPSYPVVQGLERVDDYRRCQEIQRRAWDIRDDGYVIPVSVLTSVHRHGGLVLGALLAGEIVGFSFAFLAEIGASLGLYSQLTAVLPEHQGQGIGSALKQAQRAEARRRGLALVAWAFDPLQAGNAAFNLARLGARCRRYEVDMYGPRSDPLNAGLATDRLIAEWAVEVQPPRPPQPGQPLLSLRPDGGWPRPERAANPREERLEIDIPPTIQTLKRQRPELAVVWQQRVRQAFLEAFQCGYVASGFARSADGGRCWYILEREHAHAG